MAKGQQRFRIDGASKQDVDELRQNWRGDPNISEKLRETFLEYGIQYCPKKINNNIIFYIKSSTITIISRYCNLISGIYSFILLSFVSIITPIYMIYIIYNFKNTKNLYLSDFLIDVVCSLIIFFISLFIHEMGHASACLRASNAVGGVRFCARGGLIILATDVTSIMQCSRSDKAMTAAMGPVWQCAFAAILLIMSQFEILDSNIAIFSAFIIIWAGYMSIIPSLGNDGYFIMIDLHDSNLNKKFIKENNIFLYFSYYFRIALNVMFFAIFIYLINITWI